jgi:hypothetical protein
MTKRIIEVDAEIWAASGGTAEFLATQYYKLRYGDGGKCISSYGSCYGS